MFDIIDILIFYRKDFKYFGSFFGCNKWDISLIKWFVITDENNRKFKTSVMKEIIKRNGLQIDDFSIFSIKSKKLPKGIKKVVLSEVNDMICTAKTMCNIIGRRMQEDTQMEKSWNQINISMKTNKNYLGSLVL